MHGSGWGATSDALCDVSQGWIAITEPGDRRALREQELLARAQWLALCGGR